MPGIHAAATSSPAHFLAFDDDDDGFGDFKFASSSQPFPPHQPPQQPPEEDDDWGDFVVNPLGSHPSPSPPPPLFDAFPARHAAADQIRPPQGAPLTGVNQWEKPKGALPLSIFGEEEAAADDHQTLEPPILFSPFSSSSPGKDRSRSVAGGELRDLITSLYGQAQPVGDKTGPCSAEEEEEDSDESSWEYKDASSSSPMSVLKEDGTRKGKSGLESIAPVDFGKVEVTRSLWEGDLVDWPIHSCSNVEQETGERPSDQNGYSCEPAFTGNGTKYIISSPSDGLNSNTEVNQTNAAFPAKDAAKNSTVVNSCSISVSGDNDVVGTQLEFLKTSGVVVSSQDAAGEIDKNHSTELAYDTLVDLYCRLEDGSISLLSFHLNDLKKAYEVASLSGQQAKEKEIKEEIKAAYEKLEEIKVTENANMGEHLSKDVCISQLLKAVEEPIFRAFEQEYHLSERILLAGKKLSAAIELLEHTTSVLHILVLASREEQHGYIRAWSNMAAACVQELQHGAMIWQELMQAQTFMQILFREAQYFIALGEVYRVTEILRASLKLYKPWILLNWGVSSKLSTSLDKCAEAWTIAGLVKALKNISDANDVENTGLAKAILASIKVIHDLDLSRYSFYHDKNVCRISLLSIDEIQDMKMEIWCGEHYFVKLANLWANLISHCPPQLPHLHVS